MKDKNFLVIYLDDSGEVSKTYSHKLDIKDGLVYFDTDDNNIIIPASRLLKVKEKVKGGSNEG